MQNQLADYGEALRTASSRVVVPGHATSTTMQFSTPYTPYVSAKKPVWAWTLAAGCCVAVLSTQVYILKALSDLSVSVSRPELMQVS